MSAQLKAGKGIGGKDAALRPHKQSSFVEVALIEMLLPVKQWLHTITSYNGKEFAAHKTIAS